MNPNNELYQALKEYVAFLDMHIGRIEGIASIHGYRSSTEDIEKGIALRLKISEAESTQQNEGSSGAPDETQSGESDYEKQVKITQDWIGEYKNMRDDRDHWRDRYLDATGA